ncbi:MAG: nicotinamidase, partial [Planctomycetota bacterium]
MSDRTLPLPPWYDPDDAGRWSHDPSLETLRGFAERWRREHGIRPAHEDRVRVGLLLIDMQKDFCLPEGTLFVG